MVYNLYSPKGKKLTKKIQLDTSVFDAEVNTTIMKLAVDVYLSNKRQSTAHAKTRSEVRGGGAKPWAQKGTGRARHGSIRSPIWKGGGVVFGPRKNRNYKKNLPKKVRKNAIRSAFSQHAKDKKLLILENVEFSDDRLTKAVVTLTEKLPIEKGSKVLFIHTGDNKKLYLGGRNVTHITVARVNELSVYTLLNHDVIIILQNALDTINTFWGQKKPKAPKAKKKKSADKKSKKVEKKETKGSTTKKEQASKSIDSLKLTTRIKNALDEAGVKTLAKLKEKMEKGEKIKGIGQKSEEKIKKIIKKM